MTAAEARIEIAAATEAGSYPQLTSDDLDRLVAKSRRVDAWNRLLTDPDWVETYDVIPAIAEGWDLKAGRVAAAYDFERGGQKLSRSQMAAAFREQAKTWRKKIGTTSVIPGAHRFRPSYLDQTVNGIDLPPDLGLDPEYLREA